VRLAGHLGNLFGRRDARLGLVSLLGLLLFALPFAGYRLAGDALALLLALAFLAGLTLVELGVRHLDARRLALLATLAAIDTALRLAVVQGIGGFSPIFFLVLCAGYVFGASYGFVVGAVSILVSALAEGGVGPWLPYQVFATGWVGVAAGLAGVWRSQSPGWRDVATLAAVGAIMGWLFGALMDVQVWVAGFRGSPDLGWQPGMAPGRALANFARFYVATSLGYDTFRAVGNVLMVVLLGLPVLAALSRVRARLSFEIGGETGFPPSPLPQSSVGSSSGSDNSHGRSESGLPRDVFDDHSLPRGQGKPS
jgi:energy-coupling factor transport system substrate-specific component